MNGSEAVAVERRAVGVLHDERGLARLDQRGVLDQLLVVLAGAERRHRRAVDLDRRAGLGREDPERVAAGPGGERHRGEAAAPRVDGRQLLEQVVAERRRRRHVRAVVRAERRHGLVRHDPRAGEVARRLQLVGLAHVELHRGSGAAARGGDRHRGAVGRRDHGGLGTGAERRVVGDHAVVRAERVRRKPEEGVGRELDPVEPVDRDVGLRGHVDAEVLRGVLLAHELRVLRERDGGHLARRDREAVAPGEPRDLDAARGRGLGRDEQRQRRLHVVVGRERQPEVRPARCRGGPAGRRPRPRLVRRGPAVAVVDAQLRRCRCRRRRRRGSPAGPSRSRRRRTST